LQLIEGAPNTCFEIRFQKYKPSESPVTSPWVWADQKTIQW
jgi:hypothetical protein